jgi:hypothetical protein
MVKEVQMPGSAVIARSALIAQRCIRKQGLHENGKSYDFDMLQIYPL